VVAGVALVVVTHRRDGPDLSKLKPKAYLLEDLQELSLAALKTRINVEDWIGEFLTLAYYYGDGVPASYPELAASVFMPSPDALINPYTNRPIRQVAEPSPGDIQWTVEKNAEWEGRRGDAVRITYFIFKKGMPLGGDSAFYFYDRRPYDREVVRDWVAHLSPREQRAFWMCEALGGQLYHAMYDYLGEITPTFEEAYERLGGWRIPQGVMRNLWAKGRLMRAVDPGQPSPGDFSYIPFSGLGSKPVDFRLQCYGEGGRNIRPYSLARKRLEAVDSALRRGTGPTGERGRRICAGYRRVRDPGEA